MDSNNPIPNTNTPQPAQPAEPVAQNIANSGGESKTVILWFLIGLAVVAILVGGIYFFLSRQQTASPQTFQTSAQPIVQASPKPEEMVDALDKDLNTVNVASPESDLAPVDQDLQQL